MRPILTRWKRAAGLVFGVALAISGCSDITTQPSPPQSAVVKPAMTTERILEMRKRHGAIGRYHNEGLAFVLERLKTANYRSLSPDGRCELAERAAREFHVSVRHMKLPPGTPSVETVSSFCKEQSVATGRRNLVVDAPLVSARQQDLSPAAIGYMEQIEAVMNTAQNADQLRASAYEIESAAVSNLDDTEAGEIVEVISVLYSSADYWQVNQSAWESELWAGGPIAYSVIQSFGNVRRAIQGAPMRGLRHDVSFRDYLRVVRADVFGAMGSQHSIVSYCTVAGCRAYDAFVASMREALAPQ